MTLGRKFPFQVYSLTVKVSTVDLGNLELEAILRKITILVPARPRHTVARFQTPGVHKRDSMSPPVHLNS